MALVTDIVINDGASTPVARTYKPVGADDKGVIWLFQTNPAPVNSLASVKIGIRTQRAFDPKKVRQGDMKAVMTISLPTMETIGNSAEGITPPPTVAFTESVRIEFTLSERGVVANRKHLRVLAANLLMESQVVAMVDQMTTYQN